MVKLKEILIKIARLPSSDRRWILRQLTIEQTTRLNQYNGIELLREAGRFRKLKVNKLTALTDTSETLEPPDPLPSFCQELANKTPLYAAIIIEQGSFPWRTLFLQKYDGDGVIKQSIDNQVPDLKPLVKNTLFKEWEKSISFEAYLEEDHG